MNRLAIVALLAGCTLDLPVRVHDERNGPAAERELPESVVEACELWGLSCESDPGGSSRGVAVLYLFDDWQDESTGGRTVMHTACKRKAWVSDDPLVIAHELGHLFGLDHDRDPVNIMWGDVALEHAPDEITDDQIDTVHAHVERFTTWCP